MAADNAKNGDALPHVDTHREKRIISTSNCGNLTVHIQGSLQHGNAKPVFLTVHDMGSNHAEFCKFLDHPSMLDVKERSVFVHVDLPGQEDYAPDLPEDFLFPDMRTIGHGLMEVIDALSIPYVIGLGEGAGANILARFGMDYPQRSLGLILIHCTSTVAGVMEYFRDKLINWKLSNVGMNPTAEQYLVFHKFGRQLERSENKEKVINEYQHKLRSTINPKNLRRYVETFLNRTDLSEVLESQLKTDVMLVAGSLASHLHTVRTMANHLNKTKSTLVLIDGVGDVLNEAPEKFAHNLVLYVQGLGKLSSLPVTGSWNARSRTTSQSSDAQDAEAGRHRSRAMSMEEYDIPNVRRLSLAKKD
ncbi:hypothetical protein DAPPUDRAFT_321849 [Daphnia pulex]|uniref:N-myc downstream regulated n=1 Tax=Daphnia pulex TaxID=6669 RepID=E9GU36_DAPPU|nr:hypothetical protein DAPPUDRAFT_321849 [Daphnia pulex]|eukprot:EFX76969.1 hypothetical protein DAPPUDRAFT_321849 [Daphnia pulex]